MTEQPDIIEAHRLCSDHREALSKADRCGCFYCCAIFKPTAITYWVDPTSDDMQAGTTALCPQCGIDSVIPMAQGMDRDFLDLMKRHWF